MGEHAKTSGVIGLCLLAAAGLAGCQIDLTGTPEAMHPFAASPLVAEPIPAGVDLVALTPGRRVYRRADTPDAPPVVHAIKPSPDGQGRVQIDDRLNRQVRHVTADGGRRLLHVVEDIQHAAYTEFAEPLVNVDPTLRPGESITVATTMLVRERDDLSKTKNRGTCTNTLTYDGRQRLKTPAGEFDCYRFTSAYRAKLRMASVTSQSIAWYADGVGLVAQVYDERITAVFVPLNKRYAIVLHDDPRP